MHLTKTQVNVKLEEELLQQVERLVENGTFHTKTEAFTEGLKLLLRTQKGHDLLRRMESIRQGTETYASPTRVLKELHEKEEH